MVGLQVLTFFFIVFVLFKFSVMYMCQLSNQKTINLACVCVYARMCAQVDRCMLKECTLFNMEIPWDRVPFLLPCPNLCLSGVSSFE